ncbi:hypothetical protein [Chitinimonas naiadis]
MDFPVPQISSTSTVNPTLPLSSSAAVTVQTGLAGLDSVASPSSIVSLGETDLATLVYGSTGVAAPLSLLGPAALRDQGASESLALQGGAEALAQTSQATDTAIEDASGLNTFLAGLAQARAGLPDVSGAPDPARAGSTSTRTQAAVQGVGPTAARTAPIEDLLPTETDTTPATAVPDTRLLSNTATQGTLAPAEVTGSSSTASVPAVNAAATVAINSPATPDLSATPVATAVSNTTVTAPAVPIAARSSTTGEQPVSEAVAPREPVGTSSSADSNRATLAAAQTTTTNAVPIPSNTDGVNATMPSIAVPSATTLALRTIVNPATDAPTLAERVASRLVATQAQAAAQPGPQITSDPAYAGVASAFYVGALMSWLQASRLVPQPTDGGISVKPVGMVREVGPVKAISSGMEAGAGRQQTFGGMRR